MLRQFQPPSRLMLSRCRFILMQCGLSLMLGCQSENGSGPFQARTAHEFEGTWRYESGSLSWSCETSGDGLDLLYGGDRVLQAKDDTEAESTRICGHETCIDCGLRFQQSEYSHDVLEVETEACERRFSDGATYVITMDQWEFELSQSGNMLTEYLIAEGVYTSESGSETCQYWQRAQLFRVPE